MAVGTSVDEQHAFKAIFHSGKLHAIFRESVSCAPGSDCKASFCIEVCPCIHRRFAVPPRKMYQAFRLGQDSMAAEENLLCSPKGT